MTTKEFITMTLLLIVGIAIGVMGSIVFPSVMATISLPVITSSENFDDLKADCYVSGYIDGRGSILKEQSPTPEYYYEILGIPTGYDSDKRTKEWRRYADGIVKMQSDRPKTAYFFPDYPTFDVAMNTTSTPIKDKIDLIKDDAYTRGMIDGRGSILEEQSTTGYKHDYLGVQEGYEPLPYPQWRQYANCIARNVCYEFEPDFDPNIHYIPIAVVGEELDPPADITIRVGWTDPSLEWGYQNGTFIDENLTWYYVREGAGKVNYSMDYVTCDCNPYCNHNGVVPPYCLYNNGEYP